jgi:hypothetical protein
VNDQKKQAEVRRVADMFGDAIIGNQCEPDETFLSVFEGQGLGHMELPSYGDDGWHPFCDDIGSIADGFVLALPNAVASPDCPEWLLTLATEMAVQLAGREVSS